MTTTSPAPAPLETWHGDHTDLVHVLWRLHHAGLTLADDYDEIARRIRTSTYHQATTQHAANRALETLASTLDEAAETEDTAPANTPATRSVSTGRADGLRRAAQTARDQIQDTLA